MRLPFCQEFFLTIRIQHAGMDLAFAGSKNSPIPCNIHPMKGASLDQLQAHSVKRLPGFALTGLYWPSTGSIYELGGFEPIFGRGDFEDLDLSLRWKEELGPLLISLKHRWSIWSGRR